MVAATAKCVAANLGAKDKDTFQFDGTFEGTFGLDILATQNPCGLPG
jgi:hypothetical protein